MWDLVRFCRDKNIYCQGRGSAANSAVCYALGVTNADAVQLGLLFERFLSPERDGPPDIDIDIESNRREEVIQYVYGRHGRRYAAQVANVITYRARSAVRDMAKALGYSVGQQDAFGKTMDRWSPVGMVGGAPEPDRSGSNESRGSASEPGVTAIAEEIPTHVLELAVQVEHFPRHLGIHSGGMVMCDRPVIEVCPVEWARMEGRTVLQWDKDDCAAVGLVKFDLLGLGMLTALHDAVDLVAEHHDVEIDLATLPQDPAVYDMLCEADSVGVFQVESRAQMATLPRLKPRTFYDLVVEVALIRPGPIQGGSVHPYIRRRNGDEPVTYLHPLLEKSLEKTLGVPLFQEQLMQMAIDVAGFTPAEADLLRQAMGSKRSQERMEQLRRRLYEGMAERGITGDIADQLYAKLAAFANYGFPESHSVSFAYLVYASSWIKRYYPAAFCAALLNAQPMGFYSPHSLVQDARRHGVTVRTPDLNASGAGATLEWEGCGRHEDRRQRELAAARSRHPAAGRGARPIAHHRRRQGPVPVRAASTWPSRRFAWACRRCATSATTWPPPSWPSATRTVTTSPWRTCAGAWRRAPRPPAGPAWSWPGSKRWPPPGPSAASGRAMTTASPWSAGGRCGARGRWPRPATTGCPGIVTGVHAPPLPGMDDQELSAADLWATGVAPEGHPTRFLRADLDELGVVTAAGLRGTETGTHVLVAGVVTHRQRPATAGGTTFLNLEDETGLINVVVSKGCWLRHRVVARTAPAMLIRGRLEKAEGVINVVAERLDLLPLKATAALPRLPLTLSFLAVRVHETFTLTAKTGEHGSNPDGDHIDASISQTR